MCPVPVSSLQTEWMRRVSRAVGQWLDYAMHLYLISFLFIAIFLFPQNKLKPNLIISRPLPPPPLARTLLRILRHTNGLHMRGAGQQPRIPNRHGVHLGRASPRERRHARVPDLPQFLRQRRHVPRRPRPWRRRAGYPRCHWDGAQG